jgi:hypothetical protein
MAAELGLASAFLAGAVVTGAVALLAPREELRAAAPAGAR